MTCRSRYPTGSSGNWRSRKDSAAKRSTSATSAVSRSGRSSMISSVVMPLATIVTNVATGIRSPRTHGMPPITLVSTVMRVYVTH